MNGVFMPTQVCTGATMMCSFGAAPSSLIAIHPTILTTTPAANIMDYAPVANIPPFGVCMTLSNPAVASATSAACGVLTPMPCVPVTPGPWIAGQPTVLVDNMPALTDTSKLMCAYGGVIQIIVPGQFTVQL